MYAIDDVNLWGYSVVYMEIPEVRRETIIPSWDENRRMKMASNRVHEEDDQNRNNICIERIFFVMLNRTIHTPKI
jgi:hypothetical protein